MLKTYLYIPEELNREIKQIAKSQKRSKAGVLREAIKDGVRLLKQQASGGADVLLKLAEVAEKSGVKGPKDGSVNHDYYLWGFPKRNSRITNAGK